jgi:hypothetical protein
MTEEERIKKIQDIIKEQRKNPLILMADMGPPGRRAILPNEKIGPNFRTNTKPVKVTKKEVSVEATPTGNIGSVDRTADVIGPDMSQVIKDVAPIKPTRDFTATEMAQNLMSRDYNRMKKGGTVKAKAKPKASSASKRADGCAIRGKTRGRNI